MLTRHFSLDEMIRSGTAVSIGLENKPSSSAVIRMIHLCRAVLEPLRRRYGRIIITSGYRCEQLNKLVGGAAHSQHMLGEAADIYVPNQETAEKYIRFIIDETDFDQLIAEPIGCRTVRWLHVSYTTRRKNRHNTVLTSGKQALAAN